MAQTNYSQSGKYKDWIIWTTIILLICVGVGIIGLILRHFVQRNDEPMTNLGQIDMNTINNSTKSKIAIVSMMKKPKNIEMWLEKHRVLGIVRFYIRLEETPEIEELLNEQPDVVLTIGQSAGTDEYTDIQTRQNKMMDLALKTAKSDGIDWLIHIDSDEILEGDLDEIRKLPENARTFWMQNEEAKYSDIPRASDSCFNAAKFTNCAENPKECVSYGNGKGGGRVAEDVAADGPHRFKSNKPGAEQPKLTGMIVQHYESCDFDTYKRKFQSLAKQDTPQNIPFTYYNDAIEAAKVPGDEALERVFRQYRVAN